MDKKNSFFAAAVEVVMERDCVSRARERLEDAQKALEDAQIYAAERAEQESIPEGVYAWGNDYVTVGKEADGSYFVFATPPVTADSLFQFERKEDSNGESES